MKFKPKLDKKQLDNCLKLFKVLFKMFSIPQALGTNAAERKILGGTQLIVFAVTTRKVFAAASATLKKNHFSVKDAHDCIHKLLDIVVTFN